MRGNISYELYLPHPPEKIWEAFTDSEALEHWKAPNDFEPIVGRQFTFRIPPTPEHDGIGYCQIMELEAPTLLGYTWRGGSYPDTYVRYRFLPEGVGTRLYFEHNGFDLHDPAQRYVYEVTRDGCEQYPHGWWGELRDKSGALLGPDAEEGSVTIHVEP